jgi:hypothetical protein
MDSQLTMVLFQANPNIWVVGQKAKANNEWWLNDAYVFLTMQGPQGQSQIGVAKLHGAGTKPCSIKMEKALFDYPVYDEAVINLYIEATTGIKPVPASLIPGPGGLTPGMKPATVLPFGGGPRK